MIGDSPVTFDNGRLSVKNKTYELSPGLLELIFKKSPNRETVTAADMDNYCAIVTSTYAHRKYYRPNEPIRMKGIKYKNVIANMLLSPRRKTGKALPRYMVAKRRRKMDYVYWDDPNELVDRLRLLLASQSAGNYSHSNEIISIIEELREAEIIY